MPKATGIPPPLNLSVGKRDNGQSPLSPTLSSARSPNSPLSPRSIPGSPMLHNSTMHHIGGNNTVDGGRSMNSPTSPRITAMPEFPPSPDREGRHGREPSKSFFANFKASKSSHKLQFPDPSMAEVPEHNNERSRGSSKERSLYSIRKQGSTPDLPRLVANNSKSLHETQDDATFVPAPPGSSDGMSMSQKKGRSKLGGILNRTKAMKPEDEKYQKARPPTQLMIETQSLSNVGDEPNSAPLRTAPLKADYRGQAFGAESGSMNRSRSADRNGHSDPAMLRRPGTVPSLVVSSLPKENSSLFTNISQTGKGVGDRLGKAGKGLFSKMTRSGSSTEREMPVEENYVCTTITLPLVQQTRKTRIAKKLELSRDKTEFWMPALPWRCIDYLNMNGCEEEGLYRIPGSGKEVKIWQKRFDTEYDINLFEETELYDINTIGSMFKSWLRELPDEILPKAVQNKIAQQCMGATSTPKLLKDELSKLPPFNYYLLFAITCHLSLLHSFADKNKMDYRNLCICFQPCLKIDAFCFQFLVMNWKECWQGCWTEHEYLQEEYRYEREGSVRSGMSASIDERAVSSSGSSHVFANHQTARSAEGGVSRKNSMPQLSSKQRSHSSSGQAPTRTGPGHANSSSLPQVPPPRLVNGTPEQQTIPNEQLPELAGLSPLRM